MIRNRTMTNDDSEEGAIASAWAILTLAITTMLVGLVVDLSGQLATLQQANDVAAQAARSAAQQVATSTYMADGYSIEVTAGRAKSAAVDYVRASGMTGTARIVDGDLVVDTTAHYTPRFLSLLGINALDVTGSATVRIARSLNGKEQP